MTTGYERLCLALEQVECINQILCRNQVVCQYQVVCRNQEVCRPVDSLAQRSRTLFLSILLTPYNLKGTTPQSTASLPHACMILAYIPSTILVPHTCSLDQFSHRPPTQRNTGTSHKTSPSEDATGSKQLQAQERTFFCKNSSLNR